MDTKFSVALHILTMISESRETLSSQNLATSVGTNSSYIRKVITLLKNAGLIISHQGKSGYQLGKTPKKISLFQMHQNANQECPVGQNIQEAVSPIFASTEAQLEKALSHQTLDDVINNLYKTANQVRN